MVPRLSTVLSSLKTTGRARPLSLKETQQFRDALPRDACQEWYLEALLTFPLANGYWRFAGPFGEADLHLFDGAAMQSLPKLQSVKLVAGFKYMPIGMCATGSGDLYCLAPQEEPDGPVIRVFNDVYEWLGSHPETTSCVIAEHFSDLIERAELLA